MRISDWSSDVCSSDLWECSPVKEQQVSTSEINTRRHRRELPKAAPRSKDRTFRRSRLIDAARGLFHEKGFAATTIDDILKRLGGPRGTLTIYFGRKLELFEKIDRKEADRFTNTLKHAFARDADDLANEEEPKPQPRWA